VDKTLCFPFQAVQFCREYDIDGGSLDNSSFRCVACLEDFYLDPGLNKCVQRQLGRYARCEERAVEEDVCRVCDEGSYFHSQKQACQEYPSGIQNCEEYENKTTCSLCKPLFYLQENACLPVIEANIISRCLYYATNKTCARC
jgi:hypothetical protein